MEKLGVFALLIGCFHLAFAYAANPFYIDILHDPNEGYIDNISTVMDHVERLYSMPSYNTMFRLIPVSFQCQWTVCELINSSTMALVAIGSCHFHRHLSLRMDKNLPLSLVRAESERPCDPVTWHGRGFRATRVYRLLPQVVADTIAFLSASHLMIVYSSRYVHVATSTARYLSSLHIESALVSVEEFTQAHLDQKMSSNGLVRHRNASVPIFLAVSKAEAEMILSQNETMAHYWLVLCEDKLDLSKLTESPQFCIIPTALSPASDPFRKPGDGHLAQNDVIFHVLARTVGQLLNQSDSYPLYADTMCGGVNVTVSTTAVLLQNHLFQHVFDENGCLRTDHFEIRVLGVEGFRPAGHWNLSAGLTIIPVITQIIQQTQVIQNTTLIVGTEVATPFVFLENGTWKGFCIDMLEELSLQMGFKYIIKRSVDNLWGGTNADGTWNGLVGMAVRKEIDMAVGPISVTADRERMVDFTKPYMESAAGLMVMRFEDPVVKMFRTLMPFTTEVWLTLAGLLLAIGFLFGLINKFSPATATAGEANSDRWIESMWDSAWIIFGSFMEQGAEKFPRGLAGRVVLGLWWVFTILTMASYTASLAAFLTYSLAEVPINSIYDLAEQSHILPIVKNGTNLYDLFKKQETPVYRKIYQMMQQAPVVESSEESMDMVRTGPYAFMTDREQLDLLQKSDCEGLVQAEETFNNNGLGFFVPEGDGLLEPLSNSIIKMMEAGLIDKWRRKWWSAKDVCSKESSVSRVQSLQLDSTAGPFILYACTTVVAVCILLWERAVHTLWPYCRAMMAARPIVV